MIATVIRSHGPDIGGPRVGAHALLDNAAIRSTGDWGAGSALFEATQYVNEAVAAGRRGVVHEIGSAEVMRLLNMRSTPASPVSPAEATKATSL